MRLLVDGMNVIGSRPNGWWRDRPGAVRDLVVVLGGLARETGDGITVVFDGRRPDEMPEAPGVEVVFASGRGRGAADDEIARRVAEDREPESLVVVTSDGELADRVRTRGAEVQGAGGFRRRLDDVS